MSELIVTQCDGCKNVIDPGEGTKETTRYEGRVEGIKSRDLCPKCAEDIGNLKRIIRRKKAETPTVQDHAQQLPRVGGGPVEYQRDKNTSISPNSFVSASQEQA